MMSVRQAQGFHAQLICILLILFQPSWGSTYAKPKDPSELDIDDEDLARDYKLMFNKYSEMETKMRELNLDGGEKPEQLYKNIRTNTRILK